LHESGRVVSGRQVAGRSEAVFFRQFQNFKFGVKVWGGFSAILVLTAAVGATATMTISDLSNRSQISGAAVEALSLLKGLDQSKDAFLRYLPRKHPKRFERTPKTSFKNWSRSGLPPRPRPV